MHRRVTVYEWKFSTKYGTNLPEKINGKPATLHGFGNDYDEFDVGPGNKSVAIIEYDDGFLDLVDVKLVQFVQTHGVNQVVL